MEVLHLCGLAKMDTKMLSNSDQNIDLNTRGVMRRSAFMIACLNGR